MRKEISSKRTATRLTRPWRRFVRLRSNGREQLARAWQLQVASGCREAGSAS